MKIKRNRKIETILVLFFISPLTEILTLSASFFNPGKQGF